MSGPKIVRIVTREELIAICRGLIARLDDAIDRWRLAGERHGLLGQQDLTGVLRRREQIRQLLESGRFIDLQKQIPEEITFLQTDIEERLDRKAAIETAQRTGCRRVATAAASLLASLESRRVELPADLKRALDDARTNAKGGTEAAERAIARGIALLVPESPEGALNERQRALADKLGEGEKTKALSEWLAGRPPPDDDIGQKIDTYIARLEAAEGAEAAAPYAVRAEAIVAELSASRRRMLADSLILEMAKEATARKERVQTLATLSALGAEVACLGGPNGAALVARIEKVKRSGDARAAEPLIEDARTLIESERRAIAAGARRKAVLTALSRLGYEVREGMETAWIESNRVVLKKAAAPDYGLELSGKAETGRLQFRVVGFNAPSLPRSPARDKDMEVIWCSELEELKLLLGDAGCELMVERAVPAGEQPVKEVTVPAWATGEGRDNVTPSSVTRNVP